MNLMNGPYDEWPSGNVFIECGVICWVSDLLGEVSRYSSYPNHTKLSQQWSSNIQTMEGMC